LPQKKFRPGAFPLGAGVHFSLKLKMKKTKRVPYNNIFDAELIKNLKILAAKQDKRQNDLLEEAIQDLIKKYGKKVSQNLQIYVE
jgi:hypothetical protein